MLNYFISRHHINLEIIIIWATKTYRIQVALFQKWKLNFLPRHREIRCLSPIPNCFVFLRSLTQEFTYFYFCLHWVFRVVFSERKKDFNFLWQITDHILWQIKVEHNKIPRLLYAFSSHCIVSFVFHNLGFSIVETFEMHPTKYMNTVI